MPAPVKAGSGRKVQSMSSELVICPTCAAEGERSTVTSLGSARTMLASAPRYDEDGRPTGTDPNTITTGLRCSRGHIWTEKR